MGYQILLVDDEPIIRKGIISSIDWHEENISNWAEASNGKEALELIPELRPDILITDIRMPIMDGLKLVEEVKKNYPVIKIIILSGFDDFEYAQKAIQNGVESYLLKPVGAEQLVKEVKLLLVKIEEEREKQASEARNNRLIREHYHSLKRAFVSGLLGKKYSDMDEVKNQATALGISISTGRWLAIVFSIDDYLLWSEIDSELDQDSLRYLALNIIEEVLQRLGCAFGIMGELDQITAFVEYSIDGYTDNPDSPALNSFLKEIQMHADNYLRCSLTIGIGRPVGSLLAISDSWKQALSAVRQKAHIGKAAVIYYQESFDSFSQPIDYPSDSEREIITQMRLCNRQAMHDALGEYCATLSQNRTAVPEYRQHCQRIIYMSISALEESGIDTRELPSEFNSYAARINQLETSSDFEQHLKRYFDQLLKYIQASKDEKYTRFVRMTMEYVSEHYHDDMTLITLAQAIHITPNYLSKIFKKETGINFVDWLNQFRIEKAKNLFVERPELKGYEISEQVGFHDYKYFTFVFKKYTGKTPREFRN